MIGPSMAATQTLQDLQSAIPRYNKTFRTLHSKSGHQSLCKDNPCLMRYELSAKWRDVARGEDIFIAEPTSAVQISASSVRTAQ